MTINITAHTTGANVLSRQFKDFTPKNQDKLLRQIQILIEDEINRSRKDDE